MVITCYDMPNYIQVIAGLVREGLKFRSLVTSDGSFTIELTGGF